MIHIAEQASDPRSWVAACKVADNYDDFGVGTIPGRGRGAARASVRRAFDRDVRDILEGFAWPGDHG